MFAVLLISVKSTDNSYSTENLQKSTLFKASHNRNRIGI